MFESKMVACLKANGKVLREFKDTVYVPFGSEYSILIKNLNSLRAIVNITIDGTDAVPGGLVVNANQEIDLERFVKDMQKGNKFKFIERSASVEAGRGIKTEDGLIRISFNYAKLVPPKPMREFLNTWPITMRGSGQVFGSSAQDGAFYSSSMGGMYDTSQAVYTKSSFMNSVKASGASASLAQNEAGITVPGSVSDQKFVTVEDFAVEDEEHVIVLRILGETEGNKVVEPVTVKANQTCVTCTKVNKITSKFCAECGTALTVY